MSEWAELKALAEGADVWSDEWDEASTDGSAVGQYLDAVRPGRILRLIALAEVAERTATMGPCSQTHHEHLAAAARVALKGARP